MSLTLEQKQQREGKIGASFCPYLMAGKELRILQEWMRLVGHEALEEPDYDNMWNLLFGSVIEPIALDWHERKTGQELTRRGEVVIHPQRSYVCCTLDAWRAADNIVIDCKAWSSWQKIDYICAFLAPQIIVQRACTEAAGGALLVVHGGAEPVEYPIVWAPEYEQVLWDRIDDFWESVMNLVPPVAMSETLPRIETVKTYDMRESNTWAEFACVWLETHSASKAFNNAADELKALVPEDAEKAHGHGVVATRSKAGAITIREMK